MYPVAANMGSDQQACIQFDVPFVHTVNGTITAQSLFLNEPVVYHPPHLAQPVLTHIAFIGEDYFVVGCSTTDRMIPKSQTQKVINFKLRMEEIEEEIYAGKALDARERILWNCWLNCCLRESLLGVQGGAIEMKEETTLKPVSEALAGNPESEEWSPISTQGAVLREIDIPFPPRTRRRWPFLLSCLLGCLLKSTMANHRVHAARAVEGSERIAAVGHANSTNHKKAAMSTLERTSACKEESCPHNRRDECAVVRA